MIMWISRYFRWLCDNVCNFHWGLWFKQVVILWGFQVLLNLFANIISHIYKKLQIVFCLYSQCSFLLSVSDQLGKFFRTYILYCLHKCKLAIAFYSEEFLNMYVCILIFWVHYRLLIFIDYSIIRLFLDIFTFLDTFSSVMTNSVFHSDAYSFHSDSLYFAYSFSNLFSLSSCPLSHQSCYGSWYFKIFIKQHILDPFRRFVLIIQSIHGYC